MSTIETLVMSRVHRIYLLRRALNPTAYKVYGLALFVLGLLSTVSVTSVYANMPSLAAPAALARYIMDALLQTEVVVQILVAGIVSVALFLARDLVRTLVKTGLPLRHA